MVSSCCLALDFAEVEVESASGGFGVVLNISFGSKCDADTPKLLNNRVAAVRRLVDRGTEEAGAPERPAYSHHQEQGRALFEKRLYNFDYLGLLNPTTDGQWQEDNRTQGQGAQAGGFWRSCRQRRKDAWLGGGV